MAETDVLYEFGREPGFSCLIFNPERSHMLHLQSGNSTLTEFLKNCFICILP